MKLYVVEYTVPVLAFVSIEENEVVKITVDDEAISLAGQVYMPDFETDLSFDDPLRAKAIAVAEHQVWPRWHSGF